MVQSRSAWSLAEIFIQSKWIGAKCLLCTLSEKSLCFWKWFCWTEKWELSGAIFQDIWCWHWYSYFFTVPGFCELKPFWSYLCLSEQCSEIYNKEPSAGNGLPGHHYWRSKSIFLQRVSCCFQGSVQLHFSCMLFMFCLHLRKRLEYFLISTSHYHKIIIYGLSIVEREPEKRVQ